MKDYKNNTQNNQPDKSVNNIEWLQYLDRLSYMSKQKCRITIKAPIQNLQPEIWHCSEYDF